MFAKRSAGRLESARARIPSSSRGSAGDRVVMGGGSSRSTSAMMAAAELPLHGTVPVSAS